MTYTTSPTLNLSQLHLSDTQNQTLCHHQLSLVLVMELTALRFGLQPDVCGPLASFIYFGALRDIYGPLNL